MKKEFIKRYGWTLLGIVAGMVGGYLYWRYVGCTTSLLKTGLPFIGLTANWQQIITGAVLIIAVLIDIMKEKKAAAK